MRRYRILLADDHALFRQGLRRILSERKDLEVLGEAGDGLELLSLLKKLTPEVIILDYIDASAQRDGGYARDQGDPPRCADIGSDHA